MIAPGAMLYMAKRPLILDFDDSIGEIDNADRILLSNWQEAIRFGCSLGKLQALGRLLDPQLPRDYGTVLFGSGDYHHLSYLLLTRLEKLGPFQLVVFDNHPDNMRFPFGIHCGSWVHRAARLPFISHVHVVGITSPDISGAHLWENHLRPLYEKRLTYWCMNVDDRWARRIGLAHAFQVCANPDELLERFSAQARRSTQAAYLSIDKDVLSTEVAHTNWDQGRLLESHILDAIDLFKGRIVGSDINGEVSAYHYPTWWKRWLSALDGQTPIPAEQLADWQSQQHRLNVRFIDQFESAA